MSSLLHTIRRTGDALLTRATHNHDRRGPPRRCLHVSHEPGPDHGAIAVRATGVGFGISDSSPGVHSGAGSHTSIFIDGERVAIQPR
jgi:hypothetical protein